MFKSKFTSFLWVMIMTFGTSISTSAQDVWIRSLESFDKKRSPASFITFGDHYPGLPITFGGSMHDSIWVFDAKGTKIINTLYNVDNIIERVSGSWRIGPRAPMIRTTSILIAHPPPVYGMQLLSSEASPVARVLNTTTNYYDSLLGIKFDNGYFHEIFEMGNNETLILSNGSGGSFSMINGSSYNFAALWNAQTHQFRHTYCSLGEGIPWNIGAFQSANKDTVFLGVRHVNGKFQIWTLTPGSTTWNENVFPTIPSKNGHCMNMFNGVPYVIVENSSLNFELYCFKNGITSKLLDLKAAHPGANSTPPIKGMVMYKGKIVIAGDFTKANNQDVNGIISFDESTGVIANIAPRPISGGGSSTMNDCLGIYSIDDTLYLPWQSGTYQVGLKSQTLYVLTSKFAPPVNIPPTANAGADQTITLPINSVSLSGSGTDPDGTITSFLWSQTSGPNSATVVSATSATTAVNNLVAGTYVFSLKVTDNTNATATNDVTITVKPAIIVPNIPPTAHAGADQTTTLPINSVTLIGSGTDPDGTLASYGWSKVSGSGTITTPAAASTSVTGLSVGVSKFEFIVTDDKGATASDEMTVTVNVAPPTVDTLDIMHIVYPNPAKNEVHVTDAVGVDGIFDAIARKMIIPKISLQAKELIFSVANLPCGIYAVRIKGTNGKVFTKKICVLR